MKYSSSEAQGPTSPVKVLVQLDQGNELDSSHYDEGELRGEATLESQTEPDENTHLLQKVKASSSHWSQIFFKFNVLPVAVVLVWCAIPVPYTDPYDDSNIFSLDRIKKHLLDYSSLNNTEPSHIPDQTSEPVEINFWFFLLFYFGFYNAIALLMITKIFDLYSLNWWPKWLGGQFDLYSIKWPKWLGGHFAYCVFWLLSLFVGVLIYLFTGLEKYILTWVLLTFMTMNMPLLVAFHIIHSQNRNTNRNSLTIHQKTFLNLEHYSSRPASYVRFLWFCTTLFLVIAAFIIGEAYAHIFLISPGTHSGIDAFIYVYSWLATVYILDSVTEYIIESKVKSPTLQFVFKLYFYMIYFIFYRNLFARLRDREQYILIQAASSLWVCIFYPLCMTRKVHEYLVTYIGVRKNYEDYKKQCGRSFFVRNLAENATMLGFICWIIIIRYGPNNRVYPYFNFKDGSAFDFNLTLQASCVIWAFELASSVITRTIYKKYFRHNISREAMNEFEQHPNMVITMIVVVIHVLQNMLLALLSLNFEGGHSRKPTP